MPTTYAYQPSHCVSCGEPLTGKAGTELEGIGRSQNWRPVGYVTAIGTCPTEGCVDTILLRRGDLNLVNEAQA